MESRLILITVLILSVLLTACCAQPTSHFQSVSGDFGRTWLNNFMAQNPKPAESDGTGLWNWGSAPKGRIIANGTLAPDPYYIWRSLNYTSGWLGKAYVDPKTGYPVYAYIDPSTGMPRYFYVDPKTGNPVYTNVDSSAGNPGWNGVSPYDQSGFDMPASSYYTWVGKAPDLPFNVTANYDNLGTI